MYIHAMKFALIIVLFIFVTLMVVFFILGRISGSGKALGLQTGILAPCPSQPNCLCSEYKNDFSHYIEPAAYSGIRSTRIIPLLKESIQEMGGVIQAEEKNYIASTFKSQVFGFVDDLEIRIDPKQKVIHFRSASRVGYSDRGVNRKRIETLRRACSKLL